MATEHITIIVEERGSRVVQRNLRDIGSAAERSSKGLDILRTALGGLGVATALRSTVQTIASFEQALSTVQAVSGATTDQFEQLRTKAMELGRDTRFTATQAAEGMVFLSRAGLDANKTMEAISSTLLLAQAGALDLGRASEITVTAMRGFRLETDDLGRVTDVLAKAANSATTDVSQLSDAIKMVGPVAAGVGLSIEETVAALSALSDAGLQATMAGAGLRRVISELEAPSRKTEMLLARAGFTAKDVKISAVGLTEALTRLRDAGIDTGDALEIFGDRGGPAFEVLSSSLPHMTELHEKFVQAGGTAKTVADIMDDNLNGALLRLKSAIENVVLSFGKLGGSSLLRQIIESLAVAFRFLGTHVEIVDGVLGVLALTTLPKVVSGLRLLVGMMGGGWVLALGVAVGALVAFRNEITLTQDSTTTLGDLGTAAFERIKEGGATMLAALREHTAGITTLFDDIEWSISGMLQLTARLLDGWIGIWRGAILAIHALFKNLGPALKELMIDAMNEILATLDAGFRKFYDLLGRIPGRVGEPYRRLAEEGILPRLEQTAEGASARLAEAVQTGFVDGMSEITVFEDAVRSMLDRADQIAQERIAQQAAQVPGAGSSAPAAGGAPTPEESLPQTISQFDAGITSGMQQISQTITQYGTQIEATLVNAFNSAEDALVDFVTTGKVDFKGFVDGILADLTRLMARMMLMKIFEGMGGMGGIFGAIGNAMTSGGGKAGGGDVKPGYYYKVNEGGDEYFSPTVPGKIYNGDQMNAKAEESSDGGGVVIINVSSREEMLAAMQSAEGKRIIVNEIHSTQRSVQ